MQIKRSCFLIDDDDLYKQKDIKIEYVSPYGYELSYQDSININRNNIKNLHDELNNLYDNTNCLEVSTKSSSQLGRDLSPFNLKLEIEKGKYANIESIFQSSKVFGDVGPFTDLLYMSPMYAKADKRLKAKHKNNELVTHFELNGKKYSAEPYSMFFNWIYINALNENKKYHKEIVKYNVFTDINFNPNKMVNCQAMAVAIFVSLKKQKKLQDALKDIKSFEQIVYGK